jgi:hypothetical protein
MTNTEIKKALYKQKPIAYFSYIRKGVAHYVCNLGDFTRIDFEIPIIDMGDADFKNNMEAQLLNRWITSATTPTL